MEVLSAKVYTCSVNAIGKIPSIKLKIVDEFLCLEFIPVFFSEFNYINCKNNSLPVHVLDYPLLGKMPEI